GKIVPNPELGYVAVMLTLLPKGLLGLMLASFFAAYMSTISTQLNWGASYLVNDFYKAFIKKNASNKHYVFVSIAATVLIALVAAIVTFFLSDIFTAWLILSAINAGIGVVYIARWYWWRVNAWSEISAILACLVSFVIVYYFVNPRIFNPDTTATVIKFPVTLIFTVPFSLLTWLTVTFLTPPTDEAQLIEFYRRVQPGGIGWRHIANKITDKLNLQVTMTRKNLLNALISVIAIYSILIATGKLILGSTLIGILLLGSAVLCTTVLYFRLSQEKW
ncbi:sodium:proline symporter, partial [candidate division KSB1 bacterium]